MKIVYIVDIFSVVITIIALLGIIIYGTILYFLELKKRGKDKNDNTQTKN